MDQLNKGGRGQMSLSTPRLIYFTGCDGSGKTSHSDTMLERLTRRGIPAKKVWLRFPFFLSAPLLAYARWRGFSWRETHAGVSHGYWHFGNSPFIKTLFPVALLIDAALAGLLEIRIPMWFGQTVVCERFALDMLVDLAVAFDDPSFLDSAVGRFFHRLIPSSSQVILLHLDMKSNQQRRPDLEYDRQLGPRMRMYEELRRRYGLTAVNTGPEFVVVAQKIQSLTGT